MNKYASLIKCAECEHAFKGRKERNNINYRCNYRLKYGVGKCPNDTMVEEVLLDTMIEHQLDIIDKGEIENYRMIVDKIEVSREKIEIFFKDLPIRHCFLDSKKGQLHYDSPSF